MVIRERISKETSRIVQQVRRALNRGRLRRILRSPRVPERLDEECVLFFAPEAGIDPHFSTICLAARTLQELGHKVLVTQCYQCFQRCPVANMHHLPACPTPREKARLCQDCALKSLDALRQYQLPALELGAYVTPEVRATVDAALSGAPENLLDFEYDGIHFGKLCCVDIALSLKRSDFTTIHGDERREWLDGIGASMRAYLAVDRILQELPVKAVVHFNDYSLMLAARLAARKHNVPATTLSLAYHCNIDRRKVGLYGETAPLHCEMLRRQWPKWRGLALGPDRIREIGDDIIHRLGGGKGHTIYSPRRQSSGPNVWQQLGLSQEKKLLVAFTSSQDEISAGRMMLEGTRAQVPRQVPQPFSSQIEWLREVVEYARPRGDLQFVVRVHPREGGEARNARASDHLSQLRGALCEVPENCRVVWPEDKISSYDLGEAADLVLISWSTIGQEMARVGVPVLRAFDTFGGIYPLDEFVPFADSKAEFFELTSRLLERPQELKSLLLAWRWQSLLYLDTTLDFSDVLGKEASVARESFRLSRQAKAIESVILDGREVVDINHERLLERQSPGAHAEEYEALLAQLRRVIHFLLTGEDRELLTPRPSFQVEGREVIYATASGIQRRYSPMISRLANLLGQAEGCSAKAA